MGLVIDNLGASGAIDATISINSGSASSSASSVTLDTEASGAKRITGYFLSQSPQGPDMNDSNWVDVTSAYNQTINDLSYFLNTGSGARMVYAWFRYEDGTRSGSICDSITLETSSDSSVPTGTLSIDSGATTATKRAVSLGLSGSDGVGMVGYIVTESNSNPLHTSSDWVNVTSTTSLSSDIAFTLSDTDGTKTVNLWFKDSAGNVSSTISDSIELSVDTTAPTCPSVSIDSGAANTSSDTVTLSLSATDTVGVTAYFASENSTTPETSSDWVSVTAATSYSADVSFTLSSGTGSKTIYVWFKDANGNISARDDDSINRQ